MISDKLLIFNAKKDKIGTYGKVAKTPINITTDQKVGSSNLPRRAISRKASALNGAEAF